MCEERGEGGRGGVLLIQSTCYCRRESHAHFVTSTGCRGNTDVDNTRERH